MGHSFELEQQAVVDATPEQVWEAIATGPGLDSWFLGRNDIEPYEGGKVTFDFGGYSETSAVLTWDPPRRLVTRSEPSPDGEFHQFDYTVDRREGGRTGVRWLHSGMLGGDDWEAQYEGMSEGDPMYFRKLLEYVTHFSGRFGKRVDAFGPSVPGGKDAAMAVFRRGLGMPADVAEGDRVHLTPEGLLPIEGVVDHLSPSFIGVRTDDALYRFIRGWEGTVMVGHHLFGEQVDEERATADWSAWLTRHFAP
jgi:uncharacterized protein YndB with AHSA1/START domain